MYNLRIMAQPEIHLAGSLDAINEELARLVQEGMSPEEAEQRLDKHIYLQNYRTGSACHTSGIRVSEENGGRVQIVVSGRSLPVRGAE